MNFSNIFRLAAIYTWAPAFNVELAYSHLPLGGLSQRLHEVCRDSRASDQIVFSKEV